MVEGLADASGDGKTSAAELTSVIKKLGPRWFVLRDAHAAEPLMLMQPRWAISLLSGPMTRADIKRALAQRATGEAP